MARHRLAALLALLAAQSFANKVEVDPSLIPHFDHALPTLKLGTPRFLNRDTLEGIIGKLHPDVSFKDEEGSKIIAHLNVTEGVAGFIDQKTGETRIYGDYSKLQPITTPIDIKQALRPILADKGAFPADDTVFQVEQKGRLLGSTHTQGKFYDAEEKEYARQAIVRRFVKDEFGDAYPVCGPGSLATFGVAHDNQIISVDYLWKPAKQSGQAIKPHPVEKTIQLIQDTFRARVNTVTAMKVEQIDPVYRVIAEFYTIKEAVDANSGRLLHYFPLGVGSPEQLPELATSKNQVLPVDPFPFNETGLFVDQALLSPKDDAGLPGTRDRRVTVGRYVVREDANEAEFVKNANQFWAALAPSNWLQFVDEQYFWAYPHHYGDEAKWYINDVLLALTEGNGRAHHFTTLRSYGDVVWIPRSIDPSGYGDDVEPRQRRRRLRFWIINAGETVSSPADYIFDPIPNTFDAWFPVFKGGMRAVLGWRTMSFLWDNTALAAAERMAQGGGPLNSWMGAAIQDPIYRSNPTYINQKGFKTIYGLPSGVFICGRASEYLLFNLPLPEYNGCLEIRWWE